MKNTHRSEFLTAIKEKFPEIRSSLNKEEGLLTFEVSVFSQFIQRKIDASEKHSVIDAFQILNSFYLEGNKDLKLAIGNAASEELDLSGTPERQWAFEQLPESLKAERVNWLKFMGYKNN